jgi:hypothetical protein
MAVGLPVTKSEIDQRSGDIARALQRVFGDIATFKSFLDGQTQDDLVAYGYTPEEVADLKTAWADGGELTTIWVGQSALAAPKDFRVFMSRLWGLGAF